MSDAPNSPPPGSHPPGSPEPGSPEPDSARPGPSAAGSGARGPNRGGVGSDAEIGALFREGRLAEAVKAANAGVRGRPADSAARILLAELLLFTGEHTRADTILDACADLDPTFGVAVAEFRQLLRAETARRQLFSDGRVPEFLGGVEAVQRASLAALVALRAGDAVEAARQAAEAERQRPHPAGQAAGRAFDDMRDADDLLGGVFEVLTTTGKYFWIPLERMIEIEFHPPRRPRDLYWRRASMQVADGPEGDVYVPAIYAALPSDPPPIDAQRLGRETAWLEAAGGTLMRGVGARTFLLGEDAATLMELTTLTFETPA